MPGNPRMLYNAAACDSQLGHTETALAELRSLADTGLYFNLNEDDDFAPLHVTTAYQAVLQQMEQNRRPVNRSSLEATIVDRDIIGEDLAYDPISHRFLISSAADGRIVTADGRVFAKTPWAALALGIDRANRLLWVSTAWLPHCATCDHADEGKTALMAFDLNTGGVRQRIDAPPGVLGDMTINRAGDVFVSDGKAGAIYVLQAGSAILARLDKPGEFASPQTPALSADERTLYVPDYVRGIAAIDLATHNVRWMKPSGSLALSGIDGFYRAKDGFIAVQNGTEPPRVVRFSADLKTQEVLAANNAWLGEPTHGTFADGAFYFIANSGWDAYDENGKRKPGPPVVTTIRKLTSAQ